jgi:DNA (cytosine-5)-methyltransferase 1
MYVVRPLLLDLFCGAGGAAMGYHRAGFDVVGIDNRPQRHYPFRFILGDALNPPVDLSRFDAIHASPPCQKFSVCTPTAYKGDHPDLIAPVRRMLVEAGLPFVIENVPGARRVLQDPIRLCGTQFGLPLWRHRYFECEGFERPLLLAPCEHRGGPVLISGSPRRNGCRREPSTEERRRAMQTPWMTRTDMDQAIPPAYTEFIGRQLLRAI